MQFLPLDLNGAYVIELEKREDSRGFFARGFCKNEFGTYGLENCFVQCNVSWSEKKGTLRGMHYQSPPRDEVKVVRCTRGALYDVIVDLRPDSPTYCRWAAVELSEKSYKMIYVPKGFAHGYQTLEDNTESFYLVSEFYAPEFERGIRWDDPRFAIEWPLPEPILSEKDSTVPNFQA